MLLHWQLQGEDGVFAWSGWRGDGAAVQGDYLTADAEANAWTIGLCGEEGDEDAVENFGHDATTVVLHLY
mgnify:CR=1 FL=1